MADIFISYSSKDREKAEQLTELLISAGLSVWIDKHGIDAATSWSKEIVQAIDNCKALLVLLSPNSVVSVNVAKEVSLAAEQKKKILPLDLEPVELTDDLRYHLAGIQRAPMTNIDAIIRAVGKLGLEATQAPTLKLIKETDSRKSLMILPFEDLSPTGDNGWFADGIASELITGLTNVKALRVADQQATKDYKRYTGTLPVFAKQMNVRYFVQGDVRKFGDNIKVTARLLDIETGDHLWQDVLKGTMDEVFEIQEQVASRVIEGLNVIMTDQEKKKLAERGTENAEAYELYLKAREYFSRQTKESRELAVQLAKEAIKLDPGFALAYHQQAIALTQLYRSYYRDPALLDEAEALCKEALRLRPDLYPIYHPLLQVYLHRGQLEEAERIGKEFVRMAPDNSESYGALGFFYISIGKYAEAVAPLEEAVRLRPDDLVSLSNLVYSCHYVGDKDKCVKSALLALPVSERFIKLHPDDESARVHHAHMLFFDGNVEDARTLAMQLRNAKDGVSLHNIACLIANFGDKEEALATSRKALAAGYKNVGQLREFLNEDYDGIAALRDTPEYQELERMVNDIEAAQKKHG